MVTKVTRKPTPLREARVWGCFEVTRLSECAWEPFFRPPGACLFPTSYPRLAPWAAFWRRFAAKSGDVIPLRE